VPLIPLRRSSTDGTIVGLVESEPGRFLCTASVPGLSPGTFVVRYFATADGALVGTCEFLAGSAGPHGRGAVSALYEPISNGPGDVPRYRILMAFLAEAPEVVEAWYREPDNGPMPAEVARVLGLPIVAPPPPAAGPQEAGPESNTPATATRRLVTRPEERRVIQAIGIAHAALQRGENLNVTAIARTVGVERTRLYRNEAFRALIELERRECEERQQRLPRPFGG
jgi:hypothetical protein